MSGVAPPTTIMSLCAGIGGLDLGVRLAVPSARTVCYVEIEAYAAAILVARMGEGAMDPAPIWDDLVTFDGAPWRGSVDLVIAGFPCQPWSAAGRQRGTKDERWIWPAIARIVRDVGPRWVFLENVPGLVSGGGLAPVLADLALLGFDAEWMPVSAREVGAPHRRRRIFILAHGTDDGQGMGNSDRAPEDRESEGGGERHPAREPSEPLADADAPGLEESGSEGRPSVGPARGHVCGVAGGGVADPPRIPGGERTGRERVLEGREELADTSDRGARDEAARELETWRDAPGGGSGVSDPSLRSAWDPGPWPPPPNDRESWERVLARAPYLEPSFRRVAHEFPNRMDRLRALGNGVVPLVAARAWRELWLRLMSD